MKTLTTAALLSCIAATSALAASETMKSVPADGSTVTNFYKQSVYDTKQSKIGTIDDVLLDKQGKVSALIVGVGGFLGVGEKDVAVPFKALKVAEKNGDRYLVMNTTKEALQSAPGYTFDKSKGVWVPSTKAG
jgi:sporulation protein YlmC with PRC-barrel domain